MSSYMSKLILVGHLGREPELRYTPQGKEVTDFSMAIDVQYGGVDGGEPKKDTIWWKVTAWGATAANCAKYLKKGDLVLVEGRLDYDKATGGPVTWVGKDEVTHAQFGVVAQSVKFLNTKGAGGNESSGASPVLPPEEDIPF
jgi:single-strand DNA-binding protein